MNILDLASKNGRTYRKVSAIHGGEYHGPCPACGGDDRFHIWPQQGDNGSFWCRGCDQGGDAIEYLRKIEGFSFQAACKEIGRDLPEQEEFQKPQFKKPGSETFQPRTIDAPADLWVEHAEKFVELCHQALLADEDQLAYLAGRGLTLETAIKNRYGWNAGEKGKDSYRAREAWGLETIEKDGKKKKLWLPVGLVIPCYVNNVLRRIRIRIPNNRRTEQFSLPYYLVPGSSMDTYVLNPTAKAFVIIEAELDAGLVDQCAGDLVGVMAMGNSTAKPTAAAFPLLKDCLHISNALDYDAEYLADGSYKNPGGVGWLWWKKHFPQAERWPVAVGKDPGDMFKAGVDVREWVKAGLPPILTLPPVAPVAARPVRQDNSGAGVSSVAPEREKGPTVAAPADQPEYVELRPLVSEDGREYFITDNAGAYGRLVAASRIVFTPEEMENVILFSTDKEHFRRFLDVKQIFPGITVAEVGPVPADLGKPGYQGKFYHAK